ncbi:MAG: hypothetical protein KRP56_06060 [Candidatus Methanogranum gryphiswaldense]|nr:MAG: hypothetical protein KRP56_06060 [Candidatus Methanogranum sp. U3.2.1]
MKTPQQRMEEYGDIRNDIWKIFESKGYYPQEMAGPLSNMIVELCVITSDKPLMDINTICKTMTSDVKNMLKMVKEENNNVE